MNSHLFTSTSLTKTDQSFSSDRTKKRKKKPKTSLKIKRK